MENQELEAINNGTDQTPEAPPTADAAVDQPDEASDVGAADENQPAPDNPVVELALKDLQSRRDELSTEITLLTNRKQQLEACLLYTSPSPRDGLLSRMPSSA